MSDVYLIKKETLTAIADMIRGNVCVEAGYQIPQAITPENMPYHIGTSVVDSNYDCGYDNGYDYGYIRGENNQLIYHAPIILQGKIKPTVVSNYYYYPTENTQQRVMYNEESFDEGIVGENIDGDIIYYSWYNDIDYEVMISGSSLTLGVTNKSNFYVDVFLNVLVAIGSGGLTPRNVVVSIDPRSSGSYGETFDSTVRQGYVESVAGFRFYMHKGA